MLLIKITILLIVITIIFGFFVKIYLSNNMMEALMLHYRNNDKWYVTVLGALVIIDIMLVFISLVWFLFFR